MTLTDFLLARVAEDEAVCQAYKAEVIEDLGRWDDALLSAIDLDHTREMGYPYITIDSSRILAECEAKRRIVELHEVDPIRRVPEWSLFPGALSGGCCVICAGEHNFPGPDGKPDPCETLRLLALPYADHPDYDEEWTP